MAWLVVRVEGKDVWLAREDRRWFGLRTTRTEVRHGFYTTRVVQAARPTEAGARADAMVLEEIDVLCVNGPLRPYFTAITEVREADESANPEQFVNQGFSFYQQDGMDSGSGS